MIYGKIQEGERDCLSEKVKIFYISEAEIKILWIKSQDLKIKNLEGPINFSDFQKPLSSIISQF